jgi:hypothetical protein
LTLTLKKRNRQRKMKVMECEKDRHLTHSINSIFFANCKSTYHTALHLGSKQHTNIHSKSTMCNGSTRLSRTQHTYRLTTPLSPLSTSITFTMYKIVVITLHTCPKTTQEPPE